MTEQNSTPDPAPAAPTPEPKAETNTKSAPVETKGYAVYDKTYQRFVGGVYPTKKAAQDEAKARKVKVSEIREV